MRVVNRPAHRVAGIKSGDNVADFMPGNGYFTRILCKVVGESGHIYAIAIPSSPRRSRGPHVHQRDRDRPEVREALRAAALVVR